MFQHLFTSESAPSAHKTIFTLEFFLVQLNALIIFIESFKMRNAQKELLHQINSIDFIMEQTIGIDLNYPQYKRINLIRTIRWSTLLTIIPVINYMILSTYNTLAHRWWLMLNLSMFFCSMRYYHATTFIDIIYQRFKKINDFVTSFHSNDINGFELNIEFEKLYNIRYVCDLLSEASDRINNIFKLSILFTILNDFLQTLINCYWFWIIFAGKQEKYRMIPESLWLALIVNNILSLASVSDHASKEV